MEEEYSIFCKSAKAQTTITDTKPIMKESASVNALSTLHLHTAVSQASKISQVFCTKHTIERYLVILWARNSHILHSFKSA